MSKNLETIQNVEKIPGIISGSLDVTFSNTGTGILATNIQDAIAELDNAKLTANSTITAGTGTKVSYDSKGLVTSSTTLSASDIPTLNQNTTGSSGSCTENAATATNVAWSGVTSKPTTLSGYGITDAQATLVSGTNIKTVDGTSLLGSGNITTVNSVGDLLDATISSPVSGQALIWNGTAWVNGNVSAVKQTTQTTWSGTGVIDNVVGLLGWKNYGNGHVIFDASNSTSPSGTAINNSNPQVAWSASYGCLMGWNGSNTYGVRVDSSRVSDNGLVGVSWATNGYVNIGGLIIQWGQVYLGGAGYTTVTFPIAFPHAILNVQTSYNRSSAAGDYRAFYNPTTTSVVVGADNNTTHWLAIGY